MSTSLKQAIDAAKARVSAAFDAVVAKGGTKPSVANLAALPSAIDSIPSGGEKWVIPNGINFSNSPIESFSAKGIDSNNIRICYAMFQNCPDMRTCDMKGFNVSNVQNFQVMFYGCYKLESLDVSDWDTHKAITLNSMFTYCGRDTPSGIDLDLRSFDLTNVIDGPHFGYAKIKSIRVGQKWTRGVNFNNTTISKDAIVQFFTDLPSIESGSQTITLGSAKLDLLNDTEKAIATSKGWTLA